MEACIAYSGELVNHIFIFIYTNDQDSVIWL